VLSESYVFRNCARSVKTRQSLREEARTYHGGEWVISDASKYILRKFNVEAVFIQENLSTVHRRLLTNSILSSNILMCFTQAMMSSTIPNSLLSQALLRHESSLTSTYCLPTSPDQHPSHILTD
jgi:hypothetical protein